jgi:MFS family permease
MVVYLIASIGSSLCGLLTLMTVVVNWFERKRARALATLQFGISIGSLALPAVAWALVTFGWRPVSIASGLSILAVGLPVARLMHGSPELVGQLPDGARHAARRRRDRGRAAPPAAPWSATRCAAGVLADLERSRPRPGDHVGRRRALRHLRGRGARHRRHRGRDARRADDRRRRWSGR